MLIYNYYRYTFWDKHHSKSSLLNQIAAHNHQSFEIACLLYEVSLRTYSCILLCNLLSLLLCNRIAVKLPLCRARPVSWTKIQHLQGEEMNYLPNIMTVYPHTKGYYGNDNSQNRFLCEGFYNLFFHIVLCAAHIHINKSMVWNSQRALGGSVEFTPSLS